ncbi:MAG: hypothetical protein A2Z88_08060 [Omnitrophica WOR_2 bacterium GWA2_47_8]|nr:MAG: hypothetical protein A2Z88_08060 [Omnitrophica WOR_2 bacterium GWA2_47_8]
MSQNYFKGFNKQVLRLLEQVGKQAQKNDVNVYVVGGFVRDILLKRKNLDVDFVVEGDAAVLVSSWALENSYKFIVHDRFGTVTVYLNRDWRVDFASARKETYPYPGALPVVEKGSIAEDLVRRDFTINAMAVSINFGTFGHLVDEFGGQEDLKKKQIRILHDQSFKDDPTRILRAVRFKERFDFKLEKNTERLFKAALKGDFLKTVKAERLFNEFKKTLREKNFVKNVKFLSQSGGLRFLKLKNKPGLNLMKQAENFKNSALGRSSSFANVDWWLIAFMALIYKESRFKVRSLTGIFNLKKADREKLFLLADHLKVLKDLSREGLRPSDVYSLLYSFSLENLIVMRFQARSRCAKKYVEDCVHKYRAVKLSVNGDDLKAIGITDGQKIGRVLNKLLYFKLDGCLKSRKDEIRAALSLKSS